MQESIVNTKTIASERVAFKQIANCRGLTILADETTKSAAKAARGIWLIKKPKANTIRATIIELKIAARRVLPPFSKFKELLEGLPETGIALINEDKKFPNPKAKIS